MLTAPFGKPSGDGRRGAIRLTNPYKSSPPLPSLPGKLNGG